MKVKKSIFAELNAVSGLVAVGLAALVILCVALYVLMLQSPSKIYSVEDDAGLFTAEELEEIEDAAQALKKNEDINVVIITTRDKGRNYGNSDEDCARFAGDYYARKAIKHNLRDNSGICILLDFTLDYDGGRFFWLYTYGSAYYSIPNGKAQEIFDNNRRTLKSGDYAKAVLDILDDAGDEHPGGASVVIGNAFVLIVPAAIAAIATAVICRKKKLDAKPSSRRYLTTNQIDANNDSDVVTSTQTYVTSNSSGGGGGGGGFSGGGGGGGHSGGGGGRF